MFFFSLPLSLFFYLAKITACEAIKSIKVFKKKQENFLCSVGRYLLEETKMEKRVEKLVFAETGLFLESCVEPSNRGRGSLWC